MFGYKSFLELLKATFINIFSFLILFIPRLVATGAANIIGCCAFFVLPGRRRAILNTLKVIQPDTHGWMRVKMGVETLINYANNFTDFLRLYHMDVDELLGITKIEGLEHFKGALEQHSGAIVLSAHVGNWEVGANFIAALGLPLVGVVEAGGPGVAFYRLFKRYRQHFGTNILSLEDPSVGFKLRKYLKTGYLVGLIADRVITGSGIEVTYFGRKSVFPTGPAFLSLATGVPIIPAFYLRLNRRGKKVYYGYIEEPIQFERGKRRKDDVQRLTQVIAQRLEQVVKQYPDQLFCFPPPWNYGSKEQRAESKE